MMIPRLSRLALIAVSFLIAIAITCFVIVSISHPTRCIAALNKRIISVGDKVTYTVRVISKSPVEVKIPDLSAVLSQFRIIESGLSRKVSMGRSQTAASYVITQYAPGEYTIGPAAVECRTVNGQMAKLESGIVKLIVKSAMDDNISLRPAAPTTDEDIDGAGEGTDDKEPRSLAARKAKAPVMIRIVDIIGPISLLNPIDIVLVLAGAILLILIIDWSTGFARRKIRDLRRVTPYEAARKELTAIKTALSNKTISAHGCCERTSTMLKRYVKDTFKAGSSESTTADLLESLRSISGAKEEILKTADRLFRLFDLVKFSGYAVTPEEAEASIENAGAMIDMLHAWEMDAKGAKNR